jgi:hypothetical protein
MFDDDLIQSKNYTVQYLFGYEQKFFTANE